MKYSAEDELDATVYGDPRWGSITIDLLCFEKEEQENIFYRIKEMWRQFENNTSQKLFPDQLEEIKTPVDRLELYAPFSTYLKLRNMLSVLNCNDNWIAFSDRTLEDIYRIRDKSVPFKHLK